MYLIELKKHQNHGGFWDAVEVKAKFN